MEIQLWIKFLQHFLLPHFLITQVLQMLILPLHQTPLIGEFVILELHCKFAMKAVWSVEAMDVLRALSIMHYNNLNVRHA